MTQPKPQVPNYAIVEKLGEGGMASVWLAQRDQDDRLFVIKVVHEHLANDRVVQSRFLREAQVAALLDHPNIARLVDAGRVGESFYLAMEFIAGEDLESLMFAAAARRQMLPASMAMTLILKALTALHYAHELVDSDGHHLAIVHRDLSPRNLMISFDGDLKIIDFGLVRTTLGDFRTAPGMIAGTLRYMSPEQATADKIDRRSDVYTIAVVLYELLSGRPLVDGADAKKILGAVVVDVPPPLSARNAALPPGLDPVLARALEKDPERRYATAQDFHDALALAGGELGVGRPEAIAAFIDSLVPEKKIESQARLDRVVRTEEVQVEPTRVAGSEERGALTMDSAQHALTRMERRPLPPPPRRSSRVPWWLAAGALAVAGAAVVSTQLAPKPSPLMLPPPEPPPLVEVVATPGARSGGALAPDPAREGSLRASLAPGDHDRPPPTKRTNPTKPPPRARSAPPPRVEPPPSVVDPQEETKRFTELATRRLGEERARRLSRECGLALLVGFGGDQDPANATFRSVMARCRASLDQAARDLDSAH